MVMPKAVNGITIQVEWLRRRDSQRDNHPMVMQKTFKGKSIQVEWLCRRQSQTLNIDVYAVEYVRHKH
jgi:hypothetical protein